MALIAPAILAADFGRLGEALGLVGAAGATMVHVDVADGHFVSGITVGQPVIRSLRRATDLVLDVHLLVERPVRFAAEFVDAGAERLAVHPEATASLGRVLEEIRGRGAKAGVALNLATPLESVSEVLGEIDFLTVLSAEWGVKGAGFRASAVQKVRAARRAREERRLAFAIQVEGGVTVDRMEELLSAGADIFVAGRAIFHSDDPKARLREMICRGAMAPKTSRV